MKTVEKSQTGKPLKNVWRFFISIRLALVLILIIIVLSIISIFLTQVPQEITRGSVEYQAWMENVVRPDYGVWTDTLSVFGFFDIFRSPIFLGAGILLIINILCCSIRRLMAIRTTLRWKAGFISSSSFRNAPSVLRTESPVSSAILSVSNVLLQHGYRVRTEKQDDITFISASRHTVTQLGAVVSHFSLILLVIGFLLGSFLGFSSDTFEVAEGEIRSVGHDTGLALRLIAFSVDYWPDGTPREYRSDVEVYKGELSMETSTILVNHPLTYDGVRFYQSYFGPAAAIKVLTNEGVEMTNVNVALVGMMNVEPYQRPLGRLDLPGTGLTAYLVAPAINASDPILQAGQLGIEIYEEGANVPVAWGILNVGVAQEIQGLEFTYVRPSAFAGFSVKYDPGTWLVWAAFGLLLAGIIMVFYLPFRVVQAMIKPGEEGSLVYLRSSGRRGFDTGVELERLAGEMALALPGRLENASREEKVDG